MSGPASDSANGAATSNANGGGVSTASRALTGVRLRLAELARQPTTLALLVVLPPVVIEIYGAGLSSFPALPGLAIDTGTAGYVSGTLFAVAFLAGVVGLFQVISARKGDERLSLCGYPGTLLLASRLVTLLVVTAAGSLVALAVFAWHVDVAAPLLAIVILGLAGVVYGLIGVVVGTLLPRELEGSLVLVFLADADNVLSSGMLNVEGAFVSLAPLYHPHELFSAAVLEGELVAEHLLPTVAYVGLLLAFALVAYSRATDSGNGGVLG